MYHHNLHTLFHHNEKNCTTTCNTPKQLHAFPTYGFTPQKPIRNGHRQYVSFRNPLIYTWIWQLLLIRCPTTSQSVIWTHLTNAKQANQTTMMKPISSGSTIAMVWKQIEDYQKITTAEGVLFTPHQIVSAAEALLVGTGKHAQAYRKCVARPNNGKRTILSKLRSMLNINPISTSDAPLPTLAIMEPEMHNKKKRHKHKKKRCKIY